jgi:multiple sugar transport system ATP-binding protein
MATLELRNVNKTYGAGLPDTSRTSTVDQGRRVPDPGRPLGLRQIHADELHRRPGDITGGAILIGDQDVSGMSPKDRDIAMVFQSYALYPTMSVRENIASA